MQGIIVGDKPEKWEVVRAAFVSDEKLRDGVRLESIHSLTFGSNLEEEVGNVYLGNFKEGQKNKEKKSLWKIASQIKKKNSDEIILGHQPTKERPKLLTFLQKFKTFDVPEFVPKSHDFLSDAEKSFKVSRYLIEDHRNIPNY